jgi:peptidoglycan hydrolase-like protein with peptidoglycan-binding domain
MVKSKRKIWISLFLCLTLTGCDRIYKILHKEGAEEKELIGDTVPFEKNPNVQEIQVLLQIYGYTPGKIDGTLGAKTRQAIERFQKDNELEVTRFVDDATWIKLKVFKDTPFIKGKELSIQYIQSLLKNAGYDPGPADGRMGDQTKLAILKFQKKNGLKADGRIGYKTLSKLSEYAAKNN